MFFSLVKDNDHYCGGTERELAFLQSEAVWIPYSFIGYTHNPGVAGGRCAKYVQKCKVDSKEQEKKARLQVNVLHTYNDNDDIFSSLSKQ